MANWSVWVLVKENGRCPFDKWRDSNAVTQKDQAALDTKVEAIEAWSGTMLPPEFVKDYKATNFQELKVRGDKKQLRPPCIVDADKKVIILCGTIEKDSKIPKGDIETAENLRREYLSGRGKIKRYFESSPSLEEDDK